VVVDRLTFLDLAGAPGSSWASDYERIKPFHKENEVAGQDFQNT